jgi:hypothetical protein
MSRACFLAALFLCLALGAALGPPSAARAQTITVTSTSGGTGGPSCTLRDAITAANTDTATGGCAAGGGADTIELAPGATYTLTSVDNTGGFGQNGLPVITGTVTIEGRGATIRRDAGAPAFRLFQAGVGATLRLRDLTLAGGGGGALAGAGILNLRAGTIEVVGSTFNGNVTNNEGGALYNDLGGVVAITNSTLSGNRAGSEGGAIRSFGELTLTGTTLFSNTALFGGNISAVLPVNVRGSIIAGAGASGNCFFAPSIVDLGYNIEDAATCGFSAANNSKPATDPKLDPQGLRDNGGPSRALALQADSPALDAIPPGAVGCGTTLTADQRGIGRPQGAGCDIGAFEVQVPTQLAFAVQPGGALVGTPLSPQPV